MTAVAIDLNDLPLPPGLLKAFQQCSDCAVLALVGGAVRDLVLHRVHRDPLRGLPDLDLVVELSADASPLDPRPAAHRLADALLAATGSSSGKVGYCQFHQAFGTVELELDGILLDLATARRETYPVAGENPRVVFATLQEDLARRDFTINAMALVLNAQGSSLTLLDPFDGASDLEHRQLRLLHERSVEDDPTRIVRAARYAARMDFRLAPASLKQLQATLAQWPWADGRRSARVDGRVPPAMGTRLRMELELLFEREPWVRALAFLQEWGALVLVDPSLQADRTWPRRLRWALRYGLPLLPALLVGSSEAEEVARRLQLPHRQQCLLTQLGRLLVAWYDISRPGEGARVMSVPVSPLDWCTFLEQPGWSADAVALALVSGAMPRRPLLRWWWRWRHLKSPLSANDLISQGVTPGPALGQRLRQLRAGRLNQERL